MSIRILGAPDSTWLRQATPLLACPIKLINSLEPVHAVVYVPETERKTTLRKMKWSWAGHTASKTTDGPRASPLGDHMTRKDDKAGRPAKRWRDDLDKYWSDTIWQRTAQDRVIWRRHAEAFAQPLDTTAA